MNKTFNSRNKIYVPVIISMMIASSIFLPGKAFGDSTIVDRSGEIGVSLIDANPADRSRVSGQTAQIILPKCLSTSDTNCLDEVLFYKRGRSKLVAEYLGEAPGISMPARVDLNLPRSGEAQLFTPAVNSGAKGNFSVKVVQQFYFDSAQKKYQFSNFSIFVQPYTTEISEGIPQQSTSSYDTSKYAWSGDGVLGRISRFEDDIRVSVSIRIPKGEGGWFSGRVQDPIVNLTSNRNSNDLTIDAQPVTVPKIQAWVPTEQKTSLMEKLKMSAGVSHGIESGFDDSVNWVEQLKPFAKDQSTSEETVWVVRSTPTGSLCFPGSKISGFVTTNAMAYSWNPPVLKDGFLDYQVAGMHKSSTEELTKGTYDLVLSSETARCLYKFSSAPISATVSITGDSSESRVIETTVLSERNGFLKLAAYGFTFSSPVVRVKLEQNKMGVKTKPVMTISCIKGKIVKKVTSAKPICPKGYKLK